MGELLQVDEFPAGAVGKSVPRLPCGTGSVWSWIADHAVTWRRVSAGVSPGSDQQAEEHRHSDASRGHASAIERLPAGHLGRNTQNSLPSGSASTTHPTSP